MDSAIGVSGEEINMTSKNRLKTKKAHSRPAGTTENFGLIHTAKRFLPLETGSKITTLEQLLVEQLQDLYSAETQLIEALPLMAKAAFSRELKRGFEVHLKETREHARRLEGILQGLNQTPDGKTCQARQGFVKEGAETISGDAAPAVKDAGLVAGAQHVEHYEIAGYGYVRTYACLLGLRNEARTLGMTLKNRQQTRNLPPLRRKLTLKPLETPPPATSR